MTAAGAPTHLLALAVILLRALAFGVGAGLLTIGSTQIARTLRLGAAASNADTVIRRSGLLVGFGVAFIAAGIL